MIKKILSPLFRIFLAVMKLVDYAVGGFFLLVFWPPKKLWTMFRS